MKLNVDLSNFGIITREEEELYYCTPENANIIGWAGVDGIHYCTIPNFGEMIFAVSPMNAGDCVHPIAEDFDHLIALLLTCGNMDALEQCYAWDREQYEAFMQDCELSSEQKELINRLKRKFKIKPIKDVFQYVKNLQREFDYTEIPYTEDYYDLDMNPCAPLNPNKWSVTFEGGFWGHEGSVCEEVQINKSFGWDKEKWGIHSMYVCDEGLVVDYCIEVDLDELNSFLDKWNLRGGEYVEYSNMEQETIQNEHPMNICFQSKLICNGKMLETRSGSSISWVPASCNVDEFFPDMETRLAMKHYELDENKAWVLWRNSYKWEEKEETIESIEIRLNRDAKKYIGKSIGNPSQGAEVEIDNPATGQKYKMTVQDVSDEEYDSSLFNNPNMEYPTYFKTMTYSIEPDIDSMSFTFQDACEADHPRMKEQDENGPVAMCVSVIGGNRGMVGINMRNTRAVCSSLHFEKEYEVEWVPIFLVKEMEDKVVSIKKSIL